MKTSIIGWLGVVIACAALAGCGEDKHIAEVKALPFSYLDSNVPDPNMTVDQVLDHRKICDSVKWKVDKTDRDQTFVEYDCNYKGVTDSGFIAHDKTEVASAGDAYQWTYGADGKPALSYVRFTIQYKNGTSKDFKFDVSKVMELAGGNQAMNFDQAFSYFTGAPILIKPASPVTSATYGNALAALYPDLSAKEAAIQGYRWIQSPLKIYDVEKLGYPVLHESCSFGELGFGCAVELNNANGNGTWESDAKLGLQLFPVDPKDIQIAIHPSQGLNFQTTLKLLSPNKIACLSHLCFDNVGNLVGSTPASIVAQEVETNDPSRGLMNGEGPIPPMPQASPPAEKATGDSAFVDDFANGTPPATATPQPTTPQTQGVVPISAGDSGVTSMHTTDAASATQSSGGSLDACEQSWTDAFHKESGQDAAISQDQLNEWDGWCKRGYDAAKGVPPDA